MHSDMFLYELTAFWDVRHATLYVFTSDLDECAPSTFRKYYGCRDRDGQNSSPAHTNQFLHSGFTSQPFLITDGMDISRGMAQLGALSKLIVCFAQSSHPSNFYS
jgi:hypothetical protein